VLCLFLLISTQTSDTSEDRIINIFSLTVVSFCAKIMAHLSSGESSKPQSPQKAFLLGELAEAKRTLAQKDEEMQHLVERLKRLEERQPRGRRWDQRRTSRIYTRYGSQEEDQDWRMHHFEERRHQHQPSNLSFPFIKLPSFSGESNPNVYLGWKAKVEQTFNVYEVQEDQNVRLASLEF